MKLAGFGTWARPSRMVRKALPNTATSPSATPRDDDPRLAEVIASEHCVSATTTRIAFRAVYHERGDPFTGGVGSSGFGHGA